MTRCSDTHILSGLDGTLLDAKKLSVALKLQVQSCDVVPGSERRWPQSHSAKLLVILADDQRSTLALFLKKIIANDLPTKDLKALERDLISNRVESRFYRDFVPDFVKKGVRLPKAFYVAERLESLDSLEGKCDEEKEKMLRSGGIFLLLESAENYTQTSPFNFLQASCSLRALALLHASGWQDRTLLESVASRLNAIGGYWALSRRGEAEMVNMNENWANYLKEFTPYATDLLERPEVIQLAQRLEKAAPIVSQVMTVGPGDQFATLIHGDYKAMNVFLPCDDVEKNDALIIDFQWVGVGCAMSDVAMHLSHSVMATALQGGGEERLVEMYRAALVQKLQPDFAAAYTSSVAWRHYKLGVLDWARMVLSVFFKGASPEKFRSRADELNYGFVYRNVEASLAFVERVDKYLTEFEREFDEQPPGKKMKS